MFDFWAKIDSGYSSAYFMRYSYGHFDQCLKFRHKISAANIIQGQHCLVTLTAVEKSTNSNENDAEFDWREM